MLRDIPTHCIVVTLSDSIDAVFILILDHGKEELIKNTLSWLQYNKKECLHGEFQIFPVLATNLNHNIAPKF